MQIAPFSRLLFSVLLGFLSFESLNAQQVKIGGALGALGVQSTTNSSSIGFGPFFTVVPYENLGLMVDATFADLNSGTYFSTSPSLVGYLASPEELKLGIFGGGGFYKLGSNPLNFGLNVGALGDFMVAPNFFVGAQIKFHRLFETGSDPTVWNVFLTLSYAFETQDGGW